MIGLPVTNISPGISLDGDMKRLFEEKTEEMNVECSICLDIFDDPYLIKTCKHIFCKACIYPILGESSKKPCPLCRREFTKMELTPDKSKQQIINNVLERCKEELSKGKDKASLPLSTRKIESLKGNCSSLSEQKLPTFSDEPVSVQIKLKYGQMIQSILTEISEDQSTQTSQRKYTYKSKWTDEQIAKVESLKEHWKKSNSSNRMNDYVSVLEYIAYELADIMMIQEKSLRLSSDSIGENVSTVIESNEARIEVSKNGQQTIRFNHIDNSTDFSRLMDLIKNSQIGNYPRPGENVHTYIGNQEVKRSDANLIRAVIHLDELLLECFSYRFTTEEFSKAFAALAKVSSESVEKHNDALISLSDYCNGLIKNDCLQMLIDFFNEHARDRGSINLLGKIYEHLLSLACSNRERVQIVMISLEDSSIAAFKKHIAASIKEGDFVESTLQLLYLCEEHRNWCNEQIDHAVEKYLEKDMGSSATKLIEKFLMRHQATREQGRQYIRTLVKKLIKDNKDKQAIELIEKYFLNKTETHKEGMSYISDLIRYNVKNNYENTACEFIDKYLLNKTETHKEGMGHISDLIRYNVKNNYDNTACKLIEKYFLNKTETHKEGMGYISDLIRYNVKNNYDSTACKLIEKYFLNKTETHKEGMGYISDLIRYNVKNNYDSTACKLIDKYLLNKKETHKEGMGHISDLIQYNVKNNYISTACKLIDKYLLNNDETRKAGFSYVSEMIRYNERNSYDKEASKLRKKYNL
jgi:Zinc finger, C3HC4 type (RING finger)